MSHAAERNSNSPFPHRLLAALASSADFKTVSILVVESWVRLGRASSAILISANGPDELDLISCRAVEGSTPQLMHQTIEAPFSTLLDDGAVVGIAAESGLVGGLHLQVLPWPDLAASCVVQMPDDTLATAQEGFDQTLVSISRQLISKCTDRPVLIPEYATLEAMAEFAAGAGHEINNPLASIIGQTQLLLKNEQSTERRQAFETIGAQAWRIRDMIGNSMLFARPPQPRGERLNLVEIAQQTLQPLTSSAAGCNIEIKLASTSDQIELEADRSQLSTLISQLVRNSIEAIRPTNRPGMISVTLRDDQPGTAELSVIDDGPGIVSGEVRRHLFNPFYSGRSAGRGLGFGLCLAWQIARMHGGMILHDTPAAGGCAFHVAIRTA